MNPKDAIRSQFLAALEMLRHTIQQCPSELWNDPADKNRFWNVAYHALFYTHFYLQPSEQAFTPWAKHRNPSLHRDASIPEEPYTQADLLEYLDLCRQQVKQQVAEADLEAASGFHWLPFGKFELMLYNLRHLQQHTGELMERLGKHMPLEVEWVALKAD